MTLKPNILFWQRLLAGVRVGGGLLALLLALAGPAPAGNPSVAGTYQTADWLSYDPNGYWIITRNFDAWISDHTTAVGNLPGGGGFTTWRDPGGAALQGDARYSGVTGTFRANIAYNITPYLSVAPHVLSVHYTNGVADGASLGINADGVRLNSGNHIADKLSKADQRRLRGLGGAIQLATGAEATSRTLFTLAGARTWSFDISYNSLLADTQPTGLYDFLGFGWCHSFSARLEERGGNLVLKWDATRSNLFTLKPGTTDTYICTEDAAKYDVIKTQAGGGWLLTRRDQTSLLFSSNHMLAEDRDAHGRKLVLTYYGAQIASITEPVSGAALTFSYVGGSVRMSTITDNTGAVVTLSYDANSMLNKIVNQNGKQTTFTYTTTGTKRTLLTVVDHNGAVLTTNTYDSEGRAVSQDDGVAGNQLLTFSIAEQGLPGNNVYAASDTSKLVPLPIADPARFKYDSFSRIDGQTIAYAYTGGGRLSTATVGGQTTTVNYDADGNVTSVTDSGGQVTTITPSIIVTAGDRNGQTSVYTFDTNFNLKAAKDALNQTTTYTYDALNNVTAVTDPLGRTTSFTYDAAGNVLTVTDPAGKVITNTYDTRNNLLTSTDPLGHVTTRTYDAKNNVLTVVDALGRTTTWTYDSNSLPLTMTLPRGGVVTYAYTSGRLTQVTDPNGVITKYGYDAVGRVLYQEDVLGKRVTYTYDSIGNVLTVKNALNETTTNTYDHRNRLLTSTDPLGAVTTFTYDHNNNLLTVTDDLGNVRTNTYDDEDRLKTTKDPLNRTITTTYDAVGRPVSVTDPAGNVIGREYDAAGQVTAEIDALGKRTTKAYDSRGLMTSVTDPLSRTSLMTYDDMGRALTAKDPLNRETAMSYDALNRLTSVVDPASLTSAQAYDNDGNRVSLTNPATYATAFTYDTGGRLTAATTPEGRATTYTYNSRGLPATVVETSGQTTSFTYDDATRLLSTTDPVGTITLTRDAAGRALTVTEGAKTLTRTYDTLGRVASYTDGDGNVIGYHYDDIGRLDQLTYPDGKQVAYAYDTAGRLSTVTDWASRVTTYTYDAVGRVKQIVRPNGTKQTSDYDDAGQLTARKEYAPDGTTLIYSGAHGYDVAGQLTTETLLPVTTLVASTATQTFDHDNRLLTHNGAATTFDADGNLLTVASGVTPASYTYDARNRLTAAGGLTYVYDAENHRVAQTSGAGTVRYAVNPAANDVLVRTAADGTKTFYVYGLGLLHEQTGSDLRYYHFDRRGDTIALTDASGTVTDRASYGPYGELLSRTGATSTPFLFNGRWGVQTDGNDLYYHRARYYHPGLKRFLNQDSVLGAISSGASLNRFAYANGSPVTAIDPFGMAAKDLAPNSGDAFSVGGKSAGTTTGLTQKDYNDALALLKATKPDYYNQVISKLTLSTYSGATDATKTYSGYSNVKAGTVSVNLDSTVAAQKFSGTGAQFLAVVILHESTHIEYYREGFRNNLGGSPAMEEASIRYWVEDWAIKNGIPETVPDGRSGTGFFGNKPPFTPNFSSIYDGVVNDGYSTDPFKKP